MQRKQREATMKRIGLAFGLCACWACTTSLPVSGVYSVGKDAASQCIKHCESLDLRFAALVIMANSTGCICEPRDEPPEAHARVLSHAAGAVGGVVGQIAKIQGCRAIGIAGGADKCRYAVEELGYDACIDYKAGRLDEELRRAAPGGVDVYFDNVGGEITDAVLLRMNPFSRIPLCGLISEYQYPEPRGLRNVRSFLINRIKLQGFLVSDNLHRWPAALADLGRWVSEGRIKYRETVAEGLRNAPAAFIGMLSGKNLGKQVVKLR